MLCDKCFWFNHDKLDRPKSDGKIYPCENFGTDGWKHWGIFQKAPETCSGYNMNDRYKAHKK